jgi:cardiolipin synthase
MLTLPNFLTLLRIVAIPLFLVYLAGGNHAAAFILFLGAGVTDCVDGAVARLTDSGSTLGTMLDPLADKLLLLTSFVVLGATGAIPLWLVVLIVSRDLIVVLGWLALYLVNQESMTVAPSRLGKVTTFLQLFTVGFVLMSLARPGLPLEMVNAISQLVTALATGASGVQYVYRGLLWHQRRSSVESSQGAEG